MHAPTDSFSVRLDVVIRPCREADLPALEWFGLFTPHRPLIRSVFEQQERGDALMLVAEVNGASSGQLWVDLAQRRSEHVAEIWAVRVMPCLQGHGIGARLVAAAETTLLERGYRRVELTVEIDNPGARRVYERLGYALERTRPAADAPGAPDRGERLQWVLAKDLRPAPPIGIRWTMGDVSERGFEALRLSIWGAWKVFGPSAAYAVCVNTVSASEARQRTGALPAGVSWHEVTRELPEFLSHVFGRDMAEGVAWKLAPLRLFPHHYEISMDNDCILWEMPGTLRTWIASAGREECLLAEDVKRCYGQFDALCPPQPCNAGIRGMPPGFDLEAALRGAIARQADNTRGGVSYRSELDEQGLQTVALSLASPLRLVQLDEVSVCSPFPPHLPELGRCGAHFVGLNARHIPWDYHDRPADTWMGEHWQRHRPQLFRHTGTPAL
jgi:ribosomal protein S18 acetylase RimI-like enzyme